MVKPSPYYAINKSGVRLERIYDIVKAMSEDRNLKIYIIRKNTDGSFNYYLNGIVSEENKVEGSYDEF